MFKNTDCGQCPPRAAAFPLSQPLQTSFSINLRTHPQGREPTTSASTSAPLAHQPFPSALDFAALGMGGMRASPPPTSTDPSSLITSAALMDRLANSYSSPYAPPQTSSGPAASSGASASTPNGNGGHSGMGASASPFGGGGYGAWGGAGQSMMGADAPSSSFPSPALSLLNSSGPMGGGMQGMGANPFALAAASSGVGGMGGGGRPRARKADWVIVTEDTAIKNAAGAVAKVRALCLCGTVLYDFAARPHLPAVSCVTVPA